MDQINLQLPQNKKVYFASDFHLGAPDEETSRDREQRIVRWLDSIKSDAHALFLLGDIFDFWFEYKRVIPRGYIRLQGKLAEFTDNNIPVYFFTGNHDMWMFDYFTSELNIPVFRHPKELVINNKTFYIGHGDGLGKNDKIYRIFKRIFENRFCQWLFARIHPNTGIAIARYCSGSSRNNNKDEGFQGEDEWLLDFCRTKEKEKHHDYYLFGHRHIPMELEVSPESTYINLGEWLNSNTYGEFDGEHMALKTFSKENA